LAEKDNVKIDEKGAAKTAPLFEFPLSGKWGFTLPEH
jgi:hypothetical protein